MWFNPFMTQDDFKEQLLDIDLNNEVKLLLPQR